MPASRIAVDVDASEVIRKLRDNRFLREPLRHALVNIGRHGETEAKRRAPVDYGRLRASITHNIDDQPMMMAVNIGVIGGGREMMYAKYMEYGTGLLHDHPNWPRARHVVTGGQLSHWGPVRRGIVSGWAVARAITRRGGLRPRRYLRSVLEQNGDQYLRIIRLALRKVTL